MILYWIFVLVIIWVIIFGFYVGLFDVFFELKILIGFINVLLIILLIFVFIIWIYFYFVLEKFEDINDNVLVWFIVYVVYFIFYLNIFVVLVIGVLMMERDINVFDFFIIL